MYQDFVARRPWWALALGGLLVVVTLDHYTLTVAGLHVKLEHIVLAGGLGGVAVLALRGRWRPTIGPFLWLLVLLAATLAASLLNAPDRGAALRHTTLLALVAAGAWLVYWLVDSAARLRAAVVGLIILGGVEAAATFGVLIANWTGSTIGTQRGFGGTRVPYGTLWEPNVLGSYLAAAALLLLARLLGERDGRRAAALTAGLTLVCSALVLSVARGAWLGFGAGALAVLVGAWWSRRELTGASIPLARNLGRAGLGALGALAFVALAAALLFPGTVLNIRARVDPTYYNAAGDPSLQARVGTTRQAFDEILQHPILGHGAGSYGDTHTDARGTPGWISNLELHLLYDSGVIGLLAFLLGLVWLGQRAARTLFLPLPPADRATVLGLLGAGVALLIAFQATEGTWLGFSWAYVGLLARAGTLRGGTDDGP